MSDEFLEDFRIEGEELIEDAVNSLLALEKGESFKDNYQCLFRSFHSLKGSAGMFSQTELQKHMHFLEDLISKREKDKSVTGEVIDYLLKGCDAAKALLEGQSVSFEYFDPDMDRPVKESRKSGDNVPESGPSNDSERIAGPERPNFLVYIVDDEPDVAELIADLVQDELGYKTEFFTDTDQFLSKIRTNHPDVVLSDITMPKLTGVELMREAGKIRPHLPFILVSGNVTRDICLDALGKGVRGIVEKPFDEDYLLKLVSLNVKRYNAFKLLLRSLDFIMFQFCDLDDFLMSSGKETQRSKIKSELAFLLEQKRLLFEDRE